ncbi:MAG TPA: hypothetical protein DDW90_03885 [Cyanobacteria bacterium UBA9971]|nr:hypothetical protein [Cyanobacteria bacterium UBA9971]
MINKIYVILPVYNEEKSIYDLFSSYNELFKNIKYAYLFLKKKNPNKSIEASQRDFYSGFLYEKIY